VGGKGLLRKAAILNRARLGGWSSPRLTAKPGCLVFAGSPNADVEPFSISSREEEEIRGEADKAKTRRDLALEPLPKSPLGVSNYDALDDEWPPFSNDDDFDSSSTSEYRTNGHQERDTLYSDFNFFDSSQTETKGEDPEYDDPFAVLPTGLLNPDRPSSPPEEPIIKLMHEEKRFGGLRYFTIP